MDPIETAAQYGIAALAVTASAFALWMMYKISSARIDWLITEHAKERKEAEERAQADREEMAKALAQRHEDCMSARRDATSALENNTRVLTEIITFIRAKLG